jgi:hypothetical protein
VEVLEIPEELSVLESVDPLGERDHEVLDRLLELGLAVEGRVDALRVDVPHLAGTYRKEGLTG